MPNTNTTELEAVNSMLATIGEAPVNSITGTLPLDASLAKNTLNEINREVQSAGWHFNMRYDYTLSLDTDNKIPLADNIMRVDLNPNKYSVTEFDIIKQGSFLFNKKGNTFTFDQALDAVVTLYLDFTDLPENARRYITLRASRIFQDRTIGGNTLHRYATVDEANALALLKQEETQTGNHNIFNNYDTYNIINRGNKITE
jgi:hypothetical protein